MSLLLVLGLLLAQATPAWAADPTPAPHGPAAAADGVAAGARDPDLEGAEAERARSLTRTIMSPFCPGRTLDGCSSPNAAEWRLQIRKWVAEGLTTEEIRDRLQARTPEQDLSGGPSTRLGFWLPAAIALLSVVLLVVLLRRLSGSKRASPTPSTPASTTPQAALDDPALDAKLDEELKQSE